MSQELICKNCGVIGKPRNERFGDIWTEILAWFVVVPASFIMFWFTIIIPVITVTIAVVYSALRICLPKKTECIYCLSKDSMISTETPVGRELITTYGRVIGG